MLTSGSIAIRWVKIPNAGALTDVELEAASDAAGAFTFARPEDAAFNKRDKNEVFFVTTGDAAVPEQHARAAVLASAPPRRSDRAPER